MKRNEQDYVLGTHQEELERLGLQHAIWRPRASDAWRRAGFTVGQTLLDIGCGPGFASFDLAELVGPSGRVIGLDRSQRFLDALAARARQRGLTNIQMELIDFDQQDLPPIEVDGAWCRWVLCFVQQPQRLLANIVRCFRSNGVLVLHEYFDYSTWRFAPRIPEAEEFVAAVMRSWRRNGGEPDIALQIPRWLGEMDMQITEVRPIIDVVPRNNVVWQWPATFIEVGLERLVALSEISAADAARILGALRKAETGPGTMMITPAVLEIIARRA